MIVARRYYRVSTNIDTKRSVLISGAGPSGLTLGMVTLLSFSHRRTDDILAHSLIRKGASVDLIDSARENERIVSEGVYLPISAMRVYNQLDLDKAIVSAGQLLSSKIVMNDRASIYGKLVFSSLAEKDYGVVGIDYTTLIKILHNQLRQRGVRVNYRTSISSIKRASAQTICSFTSSKHTQPYDLVVGADGISSKVRELAFDKSAYKIQKTFPNWGYFTAKIPRPGSMDPSVALEMWGAGCRLMMLPIDENQLNVWITSNSIYPVAQLVGGERKAEEMTTILSRYFPGGYGPVVTKAIQASENPVHLIFPQEVKMKSWVSGSAVLIGDAAHAMMPGLQHGLAMGIEDAYLLAQYAAEKKSISEALAAFMEKRFERVYSAQQVAWKTNESGQVTSLPKRIWRRWKMRLTYTTLLQKIRERPLVGLSNVLDI